MGAYRYPQKKLIDLDSYARKDLFHVFKQYDNPTISVTAEVDVTDLKHATKENGFSFFIALVYCFSRVMNEIPEFRHRVVNDELCEFESVDPGYTVLLEDKTFSFCDSKYNQEFYAFNQSLSDDIAQTREKPDLAIKDKNHMFFISSIPWISFTHFQQPFFSHYGYNPVLTIGKKIGSRRKDFIVPIALQCHHGVVDGYHLGLFYEHLEFQIKELSSELLRHYNKREISYKF
ncbi:CatA-like O-acetyltransferase [Sessilibacter corallicola]|uniref:Chloramphenicol acetyltransferase n=1 Tax=Sessilibacter corallicola TaxID=2904075 RepID=A0ABQ0AAC5_9GAMM